MDQILDGALQIPRESMNDPRVAAQVGKIMRRLGWKSGGVRLASQKPDNAPVRRWQQVKHTCRLIMPNGEQCGIELTPPNYQCPQHPKAD